MDPATRPEDPAASSGAAAQPFLTHVGLLVAAAVLVLDQATKHLATRTLRPGRMVDVWAEGWGWDLTFNEGGAFGFPAPSWFFLVVAALVVVIVGRSLPRVTRAVPATAYGLLLAGGVGNALDRVFRTGDPGDPRFLHGHVVDFIAWGSFPRFNVADAAITVGFGLLMLALWAEERGAGEDPGDPDAAAG